MKYDGMVIHSTRDEYGLIEVVENRVTRKLYFDSPIEQSCLYLNAPMTLNFEYQEKMLALVENFARTGKNKSAFRVLMLGMGGGIMAKHLYHTLPNLQMTVVELRQAVIDYAYRYFQLPDEPEIEVVQEDALAFMAQNAHQYDAILVDIFDAHGLPSELSDITFQSNLWQNLQSPGLLIFNLWNEMDSLQPEKSAHAKPTPETANLLEFWQDFTQQHPECLLKQYNAQTSSNLILSLQRSPF